MGGHCTAPLWEAPPLLQPAAIVQKGRLSDMLVDLDCLGGQLGSPQARACLGLLANVQFLRRSSLWSARIVSSFVNSFVLQWSLDVRDIPSYLWRLQKPLDVRTVQCSLETR